MHSPSLSERKISVTSMLYWRRRGDYIAPFSATLLFSVTLFVKPAFSVVYDRVSAVASVSPVPSSLSYGHPKVPKKSNMSNKLGFPSCAATAASLGRLPDSVPIPSVVQWSSPKICVPHHFFHRFHLYQILRRSRRVQDREAQELVSLGS